MNTNNCRVAPKVAVVGCGYWGKNLVRNFHQLGALECVHDVDLNAAASMAKTYSVPARSLDGILADAGLQGVVIATPAETHADLVMKALDAGKGVFVEKPLALMVPIAEQALRSAREKGLTLMVGHLMQYHPAFVKLKEICGSDAIGKVRYVYSNRLNLGKIRTEENILWSFAPHDISMILGLLGECPGSVTATGHSYLNHDVPDVTTTQLNFSDGRAAHIFVSWLHPFKEQRLVVVGENGMVVFEDTLPAEEKINLYPHRVIMNGRVPTADRAKRQSIPVENSEPLTIECRHFLHCLKTGETPRTDGEEAVRVLRVLDAAERSIRMRETIWL